MKFYTIPLKRKILINSFFILYSVVAIVILFSQPSFANTQAEQTAQQVHVINTAVNRSQTEATPKVTSATHSKYMTTSRNTNKSLDSQIILSLISIILLGFLTLFTAVGYHRSTMLKNIVQFFPFSKAKPKNMLKN